VELTARFREVIELYEERFHESRPRAVWPSLGAASVELADCDASGGNKVADTEPVHGATLSDCDAAVEAI
jgi:hypothetical protein